jgi:hypothetical protein
MASSSCSGCGQTLEVAWSNCPKCGTPVRESKVAATPSSSSSEEVDGLPRTFQLGTLGMELDRNSRAARIGVILIPAVMIGLSILFPLVFWPKIVAGTLDVGGWAGLLIVWGFTGLILAQSKNSLWQCRRAAESVRVDTFGVELQYPEGDGVRFLWSAPSMRFMLGDVTDAPPSRKVLSTAFFFIDRDRISALPAGAYDLILREARAHAVVTAGTPKSSPFAPGLRIPVEWDVAGRIRGS